jgi:CcmD family protein
MKKSMTYALALTVLTIAVMAAAAVAQESAGMPQAGRLAEQNLRPYWHVFAAYALVILLIGGWAVSIARRLRAIEERLLD